MKTVVLLSGGIDSTVALAHALSRGHHCEAVSFLYGQTHRKEICSATNIAYHYTIPHHVIDLGETLQVKSSLTGHGEIPATHADKVDATFVPGRNIVMLAVAIAHAENTGARCVLLGANKDDHGGYPDCRPKFIESLDLASRLGTTNYVGVWAPLLYQTKKQVIEFGEKLGAPLELTWSCYRGGDTPCGRCGACISRNEAMA